MCSHRCFYWGNAKETGSTLKNINFVVLQMSDYFIKSTVYVCYIAPGSKPRYFLEGGGLLFEGGAYSKL